MTREIQVGDYVKVVKKHKRHDIWGDRMDAFVNNGVTYLVGQLVTEDKYVYLEETGYLFPCESLELVCNKEETSYINPVTPKTIYSRTDSYETYDTEKEALIAHFDDTIRALVLYRSNFNINTVIENQDKLIDVLKMMQSFTLEEMDEL